MVSTVLIAKQQILIHATGYLVAYITIFISSAQCRNSDACVGLSAQACAQGYTGPLCEVCLPGNIDSISCC